MPDTAHDKSSEKKKNNLGRRVLNELRSGRLPQMVDWYNPGLLAKIGLREAISHTMGQYADQRLLQAASDRVDDEKDLAHRYDYSETHLAANSGLGAADREDAVWVDYIADLGDGFEATYSMAYLMASEELAVKGAEAPLPAGDILVMGGDQAYPQATSKEYQDRLINPYNWAFSSSEAKRKLFAIPGNHDWYDGLTAFDGVFCSARDRLSNGIGKKLGGWRCQQHRSYFAIKLPYNWWIWGADIQLEGHLDDGQKDYFDLVSEYMGKDDKVVICLAEPSWLHQEYRNLREISMLARKTGARVCAVLAGDWHHYSRYHSSELGVHFITCGGGGAFAHATHSLKNRLTLKWPQTTGLPFRVAQDTDSLEQNIAEERVIEEGDNVDFAEKAVEITAFDENSSSTSSAEQQSKHRREIDWHVDPEDDVEYRCKSPHIYPSRLKSRALSFWNLLFPFHHFKFALALGGIYLLFFWIGASIERDSELVDKYLHNAVPVTNFFSLDYVFKVLNFAYKASIDNVVFSLLIVALWFGLVNYVDTSALRSKLASLLTKLTFGSLHALAHLLAIATLSIGLSVLIEISASIHAHATLDAEEMAADGLDESAGFHAFRYSWFPWEVKPAKLGATPEEIDKVERERKQISEYRSITQKLKSRITDLQAPYTIFSPILMIPIGGIIAGLIWGAYWTITCAFLSMHTGDAFGALSLRNYKHFLRMKFEKDAVTIYPIGLDKVPGRKGWRVPRKSEEMRDHAPLIVPKRKLKPHLIEPPIRIHSNDVML